VEVGTTTVTATVTAIAELRVVHSITAHHTYPVCLKTCHHKRPGSNGRLRRSYTMIFMQHTLFYKLKRTAFDCNCILSHSRRNRIKLMPRPKVRVVAARSSSKPRIGTEPAPSTSLRSQRLFVQTCTSIPYTIRDNRFMDTKRQARFPHPLL